jgi:cytochrome c biogenesis protein CcmG/thiol:disulfide interchange protein DsbE
MNAAVEARGYPGLPWSLRVKIIGVLVALLLVIGVIGFLLLNRSASINVTVQGGRAQVGSLAPDFSSQTLSGSGFRLRQYRGHPVLLNFWATWCGPCRDEMPLLQRATDVNKSSGLVVLGVNYEETSGSQLRSFLNKVGVRFPAVYDPAGQIAGEYGVNVGLPVSIFIDKAGKVSYIQVGQMSDAILQQQLRTIL